MVILHATNVQGNFAWGQSFGMMEYVFWADRIEVNGDI